MTGLQLSEEGEDQSRVLMKRKVAIRRVRRPFGGGITRGQIMRMRTRRSVLGIRKVKNAVDRLVKAAQKLALFINGILTVHLGSVDYEG